MTEETSSIEFANSYHLLQGAMVIALLIFSLLGVHIVNGYMLDGLGLMLGRDFLNMWHYGLAAFSDNPAAYYDYDTYNARLDELVPEYPDQNWSYPPHFMLIAAPFGLVGYNWALALMTLLSALVFWKVLVCSFEENAYRKSLWLMPAFIFTLICGQISVLLAALFILIYRNMDVRPWLAGLMIALMTVKPQLGFLFPIYLLATKRWNVFGWATFWTIAFIGVSIVLYGLDIWEIFLFSQIGEQANLLFFSHPLTRGLMPSLAVNFGLAGFSPQIAMTLHFVCAIIAVAFMVWACLKLKDTFLQYAIFVAICFIATPYLMAYDTIILCWLAVMMLAAYGANTWQRFTYRFIIAFIPIGMALSMAGVPGYSLILIALLAWMYDESGLFKRNKNLQSA